MPTKDGTTPNEIGQFAETLRAIIPATSGAIKMLQVYENFSLSDLNKILNQNGKILTEKMVHLFKTISKEPVSKTSSWLDRILEQEKKAHLAFFGKEFDLTQFTETLLKYGEKKILFWKKLGLESHFISKAPFLQSDSYPGWKKKPEKWFYEDVANGKIMQNINGELVKIQTVEIEGITLLVDTRCKPQYTGGSQMYKNDNFLGPIIFKMRREGKIKDYNSGPRDSRFNISADEFETQLKPEIAELLKLNISQIRFEKTIEANLIPQMYKHMPRKNDGNINTWCWYDEYFGGRAVRLHGGVSGYGGLSGVGYRDSDDHWRSGSVRFVAVLS